MKRAAALLGLLGLAAAIALVLHQGAGTVFRALGEAGLGLLWASFFHVVPMVANARAWQVLLPGANPPSLAFFTWAGWIRKSVNGLLPVARIGGEFVAVRLLMQSGVRAAPAVASVVGDMTLSILTQFIYTLLGLGLLLYIDGDSAPARQIALAAVLSLPLLVGFLVLQRLGAFGLLARLASTVVTTRFEELAGGARSLDKAVRLVYRRAVALWRCAFWQLAGWLLGAAEIWLMLLVLGHPVGIAEAIVIDALVRAAGSAAFLVPGAIGVQEAGFMVVGTLLGLPPETSLALALSRRVRDLVVLGPALVAWQMSETRRFLRVPRWRGAP
jgi:glycosyltransferase 2 family protein